MKISMKQLRKLITGQTYQPASPHIGKIVIIRGYASGNHCGELVSQYGRQVELKNSRRLWRWNTDEGISLSEISQTGIVAANSKICMMVPEISLNDALEVIPCSSTAIKSIFEAKVYKP